MAAAAQSVGRFTNTREGVRETSPLNENLRYFITPSGDEDWFRFHLSDTGSPQIHLTSLPANYDLYVYDAAGNILGNSTKAGKAAEQIILTDAAPGDYFVRVVGVDGAFDKGNSFQLRFNVPGIGGPE